MEKECDGPWAAEEACCVFCGHEWVSVHPCAEQLECPNCHRMTKSTTAIERDEWLKGAL